jgi:hypothetical protein
VPKKPSQKTMIAFQVQGGILLEFEDATGSVMGVGELLSDM